MRQVRGLNGGPGNSRPQPVNAPRHQIYPHLPRRARPGPRRTLSGSALKGGARQVTYAGAVHLGLVAVVVSEYDPAIRFFVDVMGFELIEDSPSLTNDGRPKRWVVVRPPGAVTGLLLARADGEDQASAVGRQVAGRVGFFLHVEDFDAAYARMASAGVAFVTAPRMEQYGQVAVFLDIAGNRWDLIGPVPHG